MKHFLFEYLNQGKHIVAFVGAGGKTTIMCQLAKHFAKLGRRVIVTTSTHIWKPQNFFAQSIAEVVLCTGGMSVDPDDRTPLAIKNTGAEIVSYGAPVLPGAMFLLAYYGKDVTIMGLPGCVMYAKRTIFDLVLPRVMADDKVSATELALLGEGGLCLNCAVCTFPNCGFGKGW